MTPVDRSDTTRLSKILLVVDFRSFALLMNKASTKVLMIIIRAVMTVLGAVIAMKSIPPLSPPEIDGNYGLDIRPCEAWRIY